MRTPSRFATGLMIVTAFLSIRESAARTEKEDFGDPFPACQEELAEAVFGDAGHYHTDTAWKDTLRGSLVDLRETCSEAHAGGRDDLLKLGSLYSQISDATLYGSLKSLSPRDRQRISVRLDKCQIHEASQHQLLCKAAASVYESDAKSEAPEDYQVTERFTGSKAGKGFRAIALAPKEKGEGDRPMIFSVAGTKDLRDLKEDLFRQGSGYVKEYGEQVAEKIVSYLEKGIDVSVTGHSLGGAVSTAIAFLAQKKLEERLPRLNGKKLGQLRLVTWNSFGGAGLLARMGYNRSDLSEFSNWVRPVNYRVEWDPVSMLTWEVGEVRKLDSKHSFPLNVPTSHGIRGACQQAENLSNLIDAKVTKPGGPGEADAPTWLMAWKNNSLRRATVGLIQVSSN